MVSEGGPHQGRRLAPGRRALPRTTASGAASATNRAQRARVRTARDRFARKAPEPHLAESSSTPMMRSVGLPKVRRSSWFGRKPAREDIHGMKAAKGVVTGDGRHDFSHAAVVARGLGKWLRGGLRPAPDRLPGAQPSASTIPNRPNCSTRADLCSPSMGRPAASTRAALDVVASTTVDELRELMTWADQVRRMRIYAEADTPQAAARSLELRGRRRGTVPDRANVLCAGSVVRDAMRAARAVENEQRSQWLMELERAQRDDFVEIFQAMDGRPVTIRLLDRALEEFLPQEEEPAASHRRCARSGVGRSDQSSRATSRVEPWVRSSGCASGPHRPRPLRHATSRHAVRGARLHRPGRSRRARGPDSNGRLHLRAR